jgi:hypothetical protein
MIVKYTLENRASTSNLEAGLTAPECITDGGYDYDSTDDTYIGYSDGTYPLGVTCVEITDLELEVRDTPKEISIKSDGTVYATSTIARFHKYDATLPASAKIYVHDDPDFPFYSMRGEARKSYYPNMANNNIPAESYTPPDSDGQLLLGYGEIEGVTQEWYYTFTTFDKMMTFVNSHKPISLNPTIEAKMRDNPASVRPAAISNSEHMYLASLEITATGDKVATIYLNAKLKDVLS